MSEELYDIELEPVVEAWLGTPSDRDHAAVERLADSETGCRTVMLGVWGMDCGSCASISPIIPCGPPIGWPGGPADCFLRDARLAPRDGERAFKAMAECMAGGWSTVPRMGSIRGGLKGTAGHGKWKTIKAKRLAGEAVRPEYAAMVEEARFGQELGAAVHRRRVELGFSRAELAERSGMTQPQVSRLEGGAHMPTIPLMVRLAAALEIDGVIHGDVSAPVEFRAITAA
ncbi:helix-turn-helix transcriptional regulator [Nonomuraea fuscirosea]|uniref:helix-turn-helix domain-containing protein n=1 Tax=Nonomuraea fuscirosea TaxID=1291556 RepID=UPI002DD8DA33|nr:helix-turn-helix transcriptional regulator [Nonomuraea fuscirosea]WSA50841.1 helix-turn-helix transcriptional regulator [Nonomuraea fuscirosea]